MERKGNNETKRPLILISPPGSIEAAQIDYINIPNIAKDPPSKLLGEKGLHEFTVPLKDKDSYLPKWVEEIKDSDDRMYYLQPSNVWILKEWVGNLVRIMDTRAKRIELTDKGRILDPSFPSLLRRYMKWILCEYGLHCLKGEAETDFITFVRNVIGREISDKRRWEKEASSIGIALLEKKRWREAEEPIRYLRVTIPIDIMNQEIRQSLLVNQDNFLSIDQPIVIGNTADDELTPFDLLFHKVPDKDIFIAKSFEASEDEDFLDKVCHLAKLSSTATLLMKAQILNDTTLADAAVSHNLSKQQYDAGRQELHRKKSEIAQIILTFWQNQTHKTPS